MVAPTPPEFKSAIANAVNVQNFVAVQSALLAVTQTSSNVVFTCPVGTQRTTAKIYNSGNNDCYLASGVNSTTAAVISSSTPLPASGTNIIANSDCIPRGAVLIQDFVAGTLAFAGICSGTNTTNLEISIGFGN